MSVPKSDAAEFVQLWPLHTPQAVEQSSPCFLHVQSLCTATSATIISNDLQKRFMTWRQVCWYRKYVVYHPLASSPSLLAPVVLLSMVFHYCTWKYTLSLYSCCRRRWKAFWLHKGRPCGHFLTKFGIPQGIQAFIRSGLVQT